jgi:hypothetical protein
MSVTAEQLHTISAAALPTRRAWWRRALPWAAWCLPLVALTIVLHELGHLAAAVWLGFPEPALHYGSISHGGVSGFDARSIGIVGLAGPLVTALLVSVGCSWIALRGPAQWAFALAITAASRFAVGVPYTLVNLIVRMSGGQLEPPAFDEHRAGSALGWSGDVLLGSTTLILVATIVWTGIMLPREERVAAWIGLAFGTVSGWVLWMNRVGPMLLP